MRQPGAVPARTLTILPALRSLQIFSAGTAPKIKIFQNNPMHSSVRRSFTRIFLNLPALLVAVRDSCCSIRIRH